MARMARICYPGAIYHVTVRRAGDMGRAVLFRDDADRMRFIERLADRVVFFDVRLEQAEAILAQTARGEGS